MLLVLIFTQSTMRKILFLTFLLLSIVACKKVVFDPEGPTDIRIKNITSMVFTDLSVTMSDTTIIFGDIPSHDTSDYFRFPKAFPKAEITCMVDGETYTTGPAPDIYMQYLGLQKVTYIVYISNQTNKELSIFDVIYEEPLVLEEEQDTSGQ